MCGHQQLNFSVTVLTFWLESEGFHKFGKRQFWRELRAHILLTALKLPLVNSPEYCLA